MDASGAGHCPQKETMLVDTTASVKLATIFHVHIFLNLHYSYLMSPSNLNHRRIPQWEYKMTGLRTQVKVCQLVKKQWLGFPVLEQLCPFTYKTNKKHFTSVTYTRLFVFTNISSARVVELLVTLHRKMEFCSAKAQYQYCEIINC